MTRPRQIRNRLARVARRAEEISAELGELSKDPRGARDLDWLETVGLPRRVELEQERMGLAKERRRLESEYQGMPRLSRLWDWVVRHTSSRPHDK